MNAPDLPAGTAPVVPVVRRRRLWRWALGLGALCVLVAIGTVVNAITLSRDAVVLRREVTRAAGLRTSTQVQVSVGPVLLAGARLAVAFIDDVPPEAKLALKAVRAASVGVYRVENDEMPRVAGVLMADVDATMRRRGWTRTVGVAEHNQLVMVYTRAGGGRSWDDTLPVCIAVLDGKDFVVVAGTMEGAPLVELASLNMPEMRRLARR